MTLDIAIVLYDDMTSLDAIGPMDVLRFLPGAQLAFVAEKRTPVLTDTKVLELVPWLRAVHPTTRWTTSVCSGSLLLGAADPLRGAEATSHFAVLDLLTSFGATPTDERVVVDEDRHVITAAGVSSGIDMALVLAELLTDAETADAIQLVTEYDPQPRRRSGSLATGTEQVVARAVELGRPHGAIPEFWSP